MVAESRRSPDDVYTRFAAVPDTMVAEVVNGELFVMPRPGRPHTVATTALGEELGPPFKRGRGGPGGWVILDEPELRLGADIVVPDLAGWRRERMPDAIGPEDAPPYYTVAPDWACEMLSPRTERLDREQKMPIYQREGVEHIWLINPVIRTLETSRLEGGRWVLLGTLGGEAKVRAAPFDAIELDLALLWAR